MVGLTAEQQAGAERWYERIRRSTNVAWMLRNRVWVIAEAREVIDQRLAELGVLPEPGGGITASRKTPLDEFTAGRKKQTRARGYIANYAPQQKTRALIADVLKVLEEYREHWPLTVRQVFYRLVGAFGYDKSETFYDRLVHHVANARRGGMILFEAIRDDGVSNVDMRHFDNEDHFRAHVRQLGEGYRRNLLVDQAFHVEVWCEAAGMVFQLADVAHDYSINVYSSSGFDSLTAKKRLADRICKIGKPALIMHLGDFDPSGESIFEAVAEDVASFVLADRPWNTVKVAFQRVALTRRQVDQFSLPTAPAKASDGRSRSWSGETCQLEALAPDAIAGILRNAIVGIIDRAKYDVALQRQEIERRSIAVALPSPTTR